MLNIMIGVNEKPSYYNRTYTLPDFLTLLRTTIMAAGSLAEGFRYIEKSECEDISVPFLLAQKLFAIQGVLYVQMYPKAFLVIFAEGTNGPESDVLVVRAIKEIVLERLTVGILYSSLQIDSRMGPLVLGG